MQNLNPVILYRAAVLSDRVYYRHNIFSHSHRFKAYADVIGGVMYIAFPGTITIKDWIRNLKVSRLIYPYGDESQTTVRIHKGFSKDYLSIQAQVHSWVEDTELPIVFVGHSAGGSVAQVGAVDVNYHFGKDVTAVTFGSPAPGNKAFARSAKRRIINYSYSNWGDIAPILLPLNTHLSKIQRLNYLKSDTKFTPHLLNPHHTRNYITATSCLK